MTAAASAAEPDAGDARAVYDRGRKARAEEERALDGRSRIIGLVRLVLALATLATIGAIVWAPLPRTTWAGVGAMVVAFLALVIVHARVHAAKDRASAARRFHELGLARLDDAWRGKGNPGTEHATPNHPYAGDLDLFGRGSLFELLDRTETRLGARYLATLLKGATGSYPTDVRARQEAVRDLAPRVAFREALSAAGALLGGGSGAVAGGGAGGDAAVERPDPEPFLAWAAGSTPLEAHPLVALAARVLPAITIASIAFYPLLPRGLWVGFVLLELVVATPLRGRVATIAGSVSTKERGFARFADLLRVVEAEKGFEAELLQRRQAELRATGASATEEMASLGRILSFLDARQNEVFRLFLGPLLMWDLNCVIALERWRLRAGGRARGWLTTLGEIEALASLASFAFERPDHAFPELADAACFVAKGLGHPLLAAGKRVDNDVALPARGAALIVTGSNMSGKSTLLRAVGVDAVLALAGAPVCARSLVIGEVRVATSMRIRDSLDEGVSHFYAELTRLKMVLDMAKGTRAVLFLLDEILHGTNARERLIGARAVVKQLVQRGALGAVSTHDLAIGELEKELPGEARNVHFEEQVENDKMTFDYRLRDGVVQSSNALRLMRIVGIEAVSAEAVEAAERT